MKYMPDASPSGNHSSIPDAGSLPGSVIVVVHFCSYLLGTVTPIATSANSNSKSFDVYCRFEIFLYCMIDVLVLPLYLRSGRRFLGVDRAPGITRGYRIWKIWCAFYAKYTCLSIKPDSVLSITPGTLKITEPLLWLPAAEQASAKGQVHRDTPHIPRVATAASENCTYNSRSSKAAGTHWYVSGVTPAGLMNM